MEHLGVERTTVGVVVPTGYSFNLDGTAIYLTMASLFIAGAMGDPLSLTEQIGLLVFMIVASKGAAGVSGAGLATLAGGLQAHRPDLLDGVGLIVGIDRFMSEARAVTNFSGNAVATMLVGSWTHTIDKDRVDEVLRGDDPFNELTMVDSEDRLAPRSQRRAESLRRRSGVTWDPVRFTWPGLVASADQRHRHRLAGDLGDQESVVAAEAWPDVGHQLCDVLGLRTLVTVH